MVKNYLIKTAGITCVNTKVYHYKILYLYLFYTILDFYS